MAEWKKKYPSLCRPRETHLGFLKTHADKVKGQEKISHAWKATESTYIGQNGLQDKDCNKIQRRSLSNDKEVNPRRG